MARSFARLAPTSILGALTLALGCDPATATPMPDPDAGTPPDASRRDVADAAIPPEDAANLEVDAALPPPDAALAVDATTARADASMGDASLRETASLAPPTGAAPFGFGACVAVNQVHDLLVVGATDGSVGTASFVRSDTLAPVQTIALPEPDAASRCAIDYGMDWAHATQAVVFASRTTRHVVRSEDGATWSLFGSWSPGGGLAQEWPEGLEGTWLYAERPARVREVRYANHVRDAHVLEMTDVGTYEAFNPVVVDSIDRAWIDRGRDPSDTISLPDGSHHLTDLPSGFGVVALGASAPQSAEERRVPLLACSTLRDECIVQLYRAATWERLAESAPFASRRLIFAQSIASNGRFLAFGASTDAFVIDTDDPALTPRPVVPTPPAAFGAITSISSVALDATRLYVGLPAESRVAVFDLPR